MKTREERKRETENQIIVICVAVGIALFSINLVFLNNGILTIISLLIVVIFPAVLEYKKYKKHREIEENLPDFLRDISENLRAGMTLPKAIKATKNNDYEALTPYVKRMVLKIDWGLPFDDILEEFGRGGTSVMKRTVSTIIETHRSGGKVSETFDAIGRSVVEINRIKKERSSTMHTQMLTGYIIFFVFLGILVILQKMLIPNLATITSPQLGVSSSEGLTIVYRNIFQWLILIQGFFSGLAIGKMSEGKLIAGLKHCLVLMIFGYTVLILFI